MKSSNGLYEAVIVVRGRTESEATEVIHNNTTYIEGREGSEYTLRFRNHSGETVLVVPSVDGLSVIDGKPASLKSQGYLVEANAVIDVPGWLVDSSTAAKFMFARKGGSRGERQTYAEQRGTDPNNIGVIGFAVFKEKVKVKTVTVPTYVPYPVHTPVYPQPWQPWPAPIWNGTPYTPTYGPAYSGTATPPIGSLMNVTHDSHHSLSNSLGLSTLTGSGSDSGLCRGLGELKADDSKRRITANLTASEPLGTGFGEATAFATSKVDFEQMDSSEFVFSLIYDSLSNLAKLGVPTEKFRPAPTPAIRNAFPADPTYCPTPIGWSKK